MGDERSICVLGAGIVGLTTALMVRQRYTDWNVTIVADKFDEETLSHVAAGIFRPSTAFRGPTPDITKLVTSTLMHVTASLYPLNDASFRIVF